MPESAHHARGARSLPALAAWTLAISVVAGPAGAQPQPAATPPSAPTVDRSHDRGPGLPTSLFGTYVRGGELLVYPFYEYYLDDNFEYSPGELGGSGEEDYRGRYRAHEGLLYLGYGLTDNVALEFEAAVITATLNTAPTDPSEIPSTIAESGVGDVEGQIRWRWNRESDRRPEIFSYGEVVVPHNGEKVLTGTPGWELKFGTGLVRGFSWGTLTTRVAVEYDEASSSHFDLGEYAVEYLKRLSPAWRVYGGLEGSTDEISLIGEIQWHVTPNVFVRVNNAVGLTSKATDWAPELGVVFSFGPR